MNRRKLNFLFWAVGALGKGLSGSDRIFIELAKRWSKDYPVTIYVWEEGFKMCHRQNLRQSSRLKLNTIKMESWCNWGFLICYFARIVRSIIEAWKINLKPGTIVYSASEFWMDSLPALILKVRYPKIMWVAAWYQTAPNPLLGFSEGERKNRYRINTFLFWLVQFFIKPFISKYADLVLVNNENERQQFPKLNIEDRIEVVLGAVNLENIEKWKRGRPPQKKIYDAVFQGRFHPQKGVIELIEVWRLVVDKNPHAKLAMIGDGPLMLDVKSKSRQLGVGSNVKLFGYVYDGPTKYEIFAESKIVVHPAFYDSGGMASAEAMAFGLPCVGFNLKSYESYYPRGMVKVKVGDLEAFANEVVRFLDDPLYREKIGKEALQMIEKGWSWDKRALEILDKIKRMIGQP